MMRLKVLLLAGLLQSCYVTKTIYTENIFNSWVGESSQNLILHLGSPTRIVSDGRDGQIYIYAQSHVLTSTFSSPGQFYSEPTGFAVPGNHPRQLNYQPGATMSNEVLIEKKVEYFVDKDGYIYSWHSTGYPDTYQERYTKQELEAANPALFTPPGSKNFQSFKPFTPHINTDILDTTRYNFTNYKRRN